MPSSLAATFGARPSTSVELPDVWLNMEQILPPGSEAGVNYADLNQMIARASSGLSARTYRRHGCEVTIDGDLVSFPLDFYVWPSDLALVYSLSVSGPGELLEREQVQVEREQNVIFPMSDYADLGQLVASLDSRRWETPIFNEFGHDIGHLEPRPEGAGLCVDTTCFGVLRANYHAAGFKHRLVISLNKPNGSAVKDLDISVTASWFEGDERQDRELPLDIPQCVLDYLSFCPDGEQPPSGDGEGDSTVVYYSGCSGRVLGVRDEQ